MDYFWGWAGREMGSGHMYFACFTFKSGKSHPSWLQTLVVFVLFLHAYLRSKTFVFFYISKSLGEKWSLWELLEREKVLLWPGSTVVPWRREVPSCPCWLAWEGYSITLQISCIFFCFSAILLGQVKLLGMRNISICTHIPCTLDSPVVYIKLYVYINKLLGV